MTLPATLLLALTASGLFAQNGKPGTLELSPVPAAKFSFQGFVGQRIRANIENWLLVAPKNNPGLLEMFARRDSGDPPDLVPWAGEFVGKYLISGVQATRMSDDPRLTDTLQDLVHRLLQLQVNDGYLGPWPKSERLLAHWDLWGHYHVMLGLMAWHEQTGDQEALQACRRIADLVCDTYLDTPRRVHQAGSQEMNMAILHSLALLYQETGQARDLAMAREVLEDFQQGGDYLRTGLAGKEFFYTPRPRWESLHSLQGMMELGRITGDPRCQTAFLNHWASIRRFDLRNTGGFSSGERATGNPFQNTPIETCCVIAWQAVMIDALRLTGDPTIADDLELATLNAVLGSQHPSGAWCTYDTPMNGRRLPSHVAIKFQARADTPHLNCCSVNGPRGYGSLSEWSVMRAPQGLAVNYFGPMEADVSLADGTPVTIRQKADYPVGGRVTLEVDLPQPKRFTLRLRVPAWSTATQAALGGQPIPNVEAGQYLDLDRLWQTGDRVTLRFAMNLRYRSGDLEQFGRASWYRGPILLARDDRFQAAGAATLDASKIDGAQVPPLDPPPAGTAGENPPWLMVDLPVGRDETLRLVDFASAGATGGDYATWLPATGLRPPTPVPWEPADGLKIGPGPIRFSWRRPADADAETRLHTVLVSDSPAFETLAASFGPAPGRHLLVPPEEAENLDKNRPYYWKMVARNKFGQTESIAPHKRFLIDPAAPPMAEQRTYGERKRDQMLVAAPLAGNVEPEYGTLESAAGWRAAQGPDGRPDTAVELHGDSAILKYNLTAFPEEDYTVSIWVSLPRLPDAGLAQVFSVWSAGMDDPLRLVVDRGRLFARIEAGSGYGTQGVELQPDRWYHVAAVKRQSELTLYVDGLPRSTAAAPPFVSSLAKNVAVGGNPNYRGAPEFLPARYAVFHLHARALSPDEIKQLYETARGPH